MSDKPMSAEDALAEAFRLIAELAKGAEELQRRIKTLEVKVSRMPTWGSIT